MTGLEDLRKTTKTPFSTVCVPSAVGSLQLHSTAGRTVALAADRVTLSSWLRRVENASLLSMNIHSRVSMFGVSTFRGHQI
jgi:hypothetical protein